MGEASAIDEGAATVLHFPGALPEEPKTVIKGDVALATHPWPSEEGAPLSDDAKTVIKPDLGRKSGELGLGAAAETAALPPTLQLLPGPLANQIARRRRQLSTVLALAGGVAAGLLLLALPVLWLRHSRVQAGTLVIAPQPPQDVAVSVDGRPSPRTSITPS